MKEVSQASEKHGGECRLLSPGAGYLVSFLLKKREKRVTT
jgi:hypothetical protein